MTSDSATEWSQQKYANPPTHPPVYLSIYPPTCPSVHPSTHWSIQASTSGLALPGSKNLGTQGCRLGSHSASVLVC